MTMKPLAISALLVAITGPAFAATDDELRTALIGSWGNQEDCSGPILMFNDDGTFSRTSGETKVSGTFEVKDGTLAGVMDAGKEMPKARLEYDGTAMTFVESGDRKSQLYPCPK